MNFANVSLVAKITFIILISLNGLQSSLDEHYCLEGWVKWNISCYLPTENKHNFSDAYQLCINIQPNAELLFVDSRGEVDFIEDLVSR